MEKFDVIVIGSGPGGEKAAVQAAKAGKKVGIIEQAKYFGGNCIFNGTIPSKTLREAALTIHNLKRQTDYFQVKLREDIEVATLMSKLQNVINAQINVIKEQLDRNQIAQIHGRASFIDNHTLEVLAIDGSKTQYSAENIVIATGSRPRTPNNIDVDHENILDSDSIVSIIYIPRSMVVLGGGVIACEYASIFMELGTKVTIIDSGPMPLGFLDKDIVLRFIKYFEDQGGRFIGDVKVEKIMWDGVSQVETTLSNGESIISDKALFALGRVANIEGLGIEKLGIKLTSRGHITVNEKYQTDISNIYAVGDVIGNPALASCSMEQGRKAICFAYDLPAGQPIDRVPIGIYAVPEISSVGINEMEATEKGIDYEIGIAEFSEIARGQIAGVEYGFLKLIAEKKTRKILGAQVIGDGACDLIHVAEFALINGNEVNVFLENIFNFPTLGEAYRVAALNLLNKL